MVLVTMWLLIDGDLCVISFRPCSVVLLLVSMSTIILIFLTLSNPKAPDPPSHLNPKPLNPKKP